MRDTHNLRDVQWRAGGLGGTRFNSSSACQQANVGSAAKITYTYDGRNRLTNSAFGDGSTPAIGNTYTPDGLIATTSTDGSTWVYGYNSAACCTQKPRPTEHPHWLPMDRNRGFTCSGTLASNAPESWLHMARTGGFS